MTATAIARLTAPALQAFQQALEQPEQTQSIILQNIILHNRDTVFGKEHSFTDIHNPCDFARAVPIRQYTDFADAINQTAAGKTHLLTTENACQFEETGGSTSGAKLIPYTPSLLMAFRQGVHAWLGDLAKTRPKAFSGNLYFVISPAARSTECTSGGIPIGCGDDLQYLGADLAKILQTQTLYQPELTTAQSATEWHIRTAILLAKQENLSLISAWSPTLLLQLLHCLHQQQDKILPQIHDKNRRQTVARALAASVPDTRLLWSRLDTVSCWDSHTATAPAEQLRQLLPHVHLQGKGLLATEGIATIPFSGCFLPALTSHYLELVDENENLIPLTEWQAGQRYRLILTTQGGLYRYDTQDWLLATPSPYARVPNLCFVGRGNLYSDLCGEKLHEAFVAHALSQITENIDNKLGNLFVQGVQLPLPHYVLWADERAVLPNHLAQNLDTALCANPQYAYARQIEQLGVLKVCRLPDVVAYATRFAKNRVLGIQKLPLLLPVINQMETQNDK
ncbi:GH3 family domain-containing protein [Alysiella crassa]|uniref:GH3 auxin-responsive promoter n=1 Tax=Alysiella crassa TaxID=153491 RepID=A0A376BKR4_9NEIS|nr:GH3 auxin-responsive promoter family protein [Alysiella crassa]UOP07512.1 GH3 auxin-responsive promoter family protein [Alysiella crassa]SSY70291.1 GH3 auxin-responsive promoter [Alysiella crassa]